MPLGDLIGSILSAGKKPIVPDYEEVNIGTEQRNAIQGNLGNLPDLEQLASRTNEINRNQARLSLDQIKQMLRESIPDFDAINKKASGNLLSQLSGQLPEDVQNLIQNKAAAKALSGGFGQSGMGRNLGLRDLGLNSLESTNRAMDSASRWIGQVRQSQTIDSPMFDVTSMFLSPQQRFASQMQEREFKFGRDWMKAKIDAAPDPTKAAIGQWMQRTDQAVFNTVLGVAGNVAGSYLGAGGGGGGGSKQTQYNQTPSYMLDGPKGGWSDSGGNDFYV